MIKGVIFDAGGVLVNKSDTLILTGISEEHGLKYKSLRKAVDILKPELQKGEISEINFWKKIPVLIKKPDIKIPDNIWFEKYKSVSTSYPEILAIARKIKDNGYKTAILSNTIESHSRYNKEKGIYKGFDVVVLSNEVGMRKPEKEIYLYTLKKLGLKPEECVFIDDRQEFLDPARQIGFKTILFQSSGQLERELNKLGVRTR